MRTDYSQIGILLTIVVISALSCIFDAYACRWRAQICNIFYRDRAAQRAEHLYKRITARKKTISPLKQSYMSDHFYRPGEDTGDSC